MFWKVLPEQNPRKLDSYQKFYLLQMAISLKLNAPIAILFTTARIKILKY
jgi:hypothetical protein